MTYQPVSQSLFQPSLTFPTTDKAPSPTQFHTIPLTHRIPGTLALMGVFLKLISFLPLSHCSCCFVAWNLLILALHVAGFFSSFKFTSMVATSEGPSQTHFLWPWSVIFYSYYPALCQSGHIGPGKAGALAIKCLLSDTKCMWFFFLSQPIPQFSDTNEVSYNSILSWR